MRPKKVSLASRSMSVTPPPITAAHGRESRNDNPFNSCRLSHRTRHRNSRAQAVVGDHLVRERWLEPSRDELAEPAWMAGQFIASPKLPLRFYMDAGQFELDMTGRGAGILLPNRHLRDTLRAKGYDVTYLEYNGPHASQPPIVAVGVNYFLNYPKTETTPA